MSPPPDGPRAPVEFDAQAVLERDPRVLLDRSFLGTLHAELAQELAPDEAAATLAQMGFLHGLQDVGRALAATAHVRPGRSTPLAAPLLMPWRRVEGAPGTIVVQGSWPQHAEAEAHLEGVGAADAACCHLSEGYTSGWLSGAFDADLLALETECRAQGAPQCRFVAREPADWLGRGDARAKRLLAALPFAGLRALVRERASQQAREPLSGDAYDVAQVERGTAAVHIWGPVMVLPYAGADETLQGVSLLGCDPGAMGVSVVVVDFGGALLDEAFGALAVEQLVQMAQAHGAETIFVDVSPLSERVVAELDHPPLMLVKDLEPAIALAFQIAGAQRRPA